MLNLKKKITSCKHYALILTALFQMGKDSEEWEMANVTVICKNNGEVKDVPNSTPTSHVTCVSNSLHVVFAQNFILQWSRKCHV